MLDGGERLANWARKPVTAFFPSRLNACTSYGSSVIVDCGVPSTSIAIFTLTDDHSRASTIASSIPILAKTGKDVERHG